MQDNGDTIRICREIQCIPYAGFLKPNFVITISKTCLTQGYQYQHPSPSQGGIRKGGGGGEEGGGGSPA